MRERCWIHDKLEEDTPGSVRCFECKHVYLTEADMVTAWNDMAKEINLGPSAVAKSVAEVLFCPLCIHDF